MTNINPAIFKMYDIRGIVATDLTPDTVRLVGQAFATECLKQNVNEVCIGRDGRLHSKELSIALTEGLNAGGCDVIDVGMVPTPVLYFSTHHLNTGTGIMVTGSHNPPEYNGLKMSMAGKTLYGDDITGLYDLIQSGNFNKGSGSYREEALLDKYLDRIVTDIKLARPMKIAVDCGNGVAGVIATELFTKLGCEVTELFCDVDGTFPNHHPDPSKLENLKDVCAAIKEHDLELGLAFDGDGDRVGVIDDNQNVIWPDRQMILYSEDVLSRVPGALIIYDIKSSYNLGKEITKMGGEELMWKTGHSLIKAKMKETGAALAGEMSGHIFFKERWYGFDDGLYSAARMLEILSHKSGTSSEIFNALPDSCNTPEIQIMFKEGEHHNFMEKFKSTASFENADISTIDGMRVTWAKGWGLIRPSNTTPCLVLRFEAEDENSLTEVQNNFREQILATDSSISINF
ncbi:MAG: phosphomannomutase/phosphoglucomutase [endosymbiont of Galathealinum brachiosum]|uniref:phosphomannomutase n=1 Tax=endosymbiont of Galathealinum brachiosum TaxID=2200906 RepID=A0A370DCD6_9GAMM|nr:MAG: phosphomannomutase/phosphoglucomutase [endosymbiont of Galathealinum brachiosum]